MTFKAWMNMNLVPILKKNAEVIVDIQVNIDNLVVNAEDKEEQQFYCG